jgi:hypothetical protein
MGKEASRHWEKRFWSEILNERPPRLKWGDNIKVGFT